MNVLLISNILMIKLSIETTQKMEANLDMGDNNIINLKDPLPSKLSVCCFSQLCPYIYF